VISMNEPQGYQGSIGPRYLWSCPSCGDIFSFSDRGVSEKAEKAELIAYRLFGAGLLSSYCNVCLSSLPHISRGK
jgi:hypothetical protein